MRAWLKSKFKNPNQTSNTICVASAVGGVLGFGLVMFGVGLAL